MKKQLTQLLAAGAMFFTLSMNAQIMTCNASMTATNNGNNSYTFTGSYSSSNVLATSYPAWMVDGNYIGTGASINYTATDSFYHLVCLSVMFYDMSTGDSCIAYDCDTIGYSNPTGGGGTTCQAGFSMWPDSLNTSVYYGYNTSTGGSGSTYLWDFGDGNTSTNQYPTHTYAVTGVYTVCLTITDLANNCTDTYCDSLGVFKLAAGAGMSQINILPSTTTGIKNNTSDITAVVSPNPLTDASSLNISADKAMKAQVQIVNVMGQIISSEQIQLNAGKNTIQLKTNVLTEGIYFLNISNENKTLKNIKLIK